ncbi:D-2-hydroxyacid dehydrogenase [Paraglaciecola hydrolytica]|uniref:Hydroxyacid dehydrogenase n=1 Tax=Paraglaciecola hydrolytica TaxID=1799789 RepID=A0A148KLA7_9ALTE|nr:D-2-hydroxyacid dehydrogenase [Paraglaciecola hydrolytica]KXI27060.1 hydroxyacid dehydrogenase [Paraglaciecola hydrolytica]
MYKLGILTRNATHYATLLEQAQLPDLHIEFCQDHVDTMPDLSQIDILLAEPKLAAQVVLNCPKLKWLQSTWAGNKPLFDLAKKDYLLSGVKDVFQDAMAEYVFAYMLYFSRNIEGFKQRQQKALWQAPVHTTLKGKNLGILGVGNIGKGVAQKAQAFGMQVRGLSHSSRDCMHVDQYFTWSEITTFCAGLDYLLCLLPHSQQTEGVIDAKLLALLPTHCVLINAGRGQTINEQDLLTALQQNTLKAAVLDVFSLEPLISSHPFWSMENVYITQHTAAESQPEDINKIFVKNYVLFMQNLPLQGLLDFHRGY